MKLLISRQFSKDVQRLRDKKILSKIRQILDNLKTAKSLFQFPQLTEMVGYKGYYRIKLDYHYRMGIYVDDDTVQILRVGNREGFYQMFP